MNYDKIRSMSDKELEIFIEGLKGRSLKRCTKCGAEVRKVIKVENKDGPTEEIDLYNDFKHLSLAITKNIRE